MTTGIIVVIVFLIVAAVLVFLYA